MKTRNLLLAGAFGLAAIGTVLAVEPIDHAAHHAARQAKADASSPVAMPMQGAMMAPAQRAQMQALMANPQAMQALMAQPGAMQAMHQAFHTQPPTSSADKDGTPTPAQ